MDAIKQFYALPVAVWETAVEEPDPAKRWAILAAVTNYAFYGVEPEAPTGIVKVVFNLQKPVIDKSKNKARFGNENAKKTQIERKRNASETQKNAPLNKNKNKTENETENEKINVRESALIDEIYKAYPARNRRDYKATCISIADEARAYANVNGVTIGDALGYMLEQVKTFAEIAGRSKYVVKSDTFFAQGDWHGDAEQWRAQFADDETGGMTLAEEIERENTKRRAEENDPALAAEAMERIAEMTKRAEELRQ